jgi:hypothetical protein
VLRHGTEPARASGGAELMITLAELRQLVEGNFIAARLPRDWAWEATSSELRLIGMCLNAASYLREQQWRSIETDVVAGWPEERSPDL